jgi:two-component system chemotaxis sensor kinase CheA
LNQVLGLESANLPEAVSIVVLQAEDRQFGLVVDGINDTQEIVVKPLGKQLKGLTLYAGATIMGDGRVALILDVLGIGQCSGVFGEAREAARAAHKQEIPVEIDQQRLLLFCSGSFERLAVPLSLVARLEEFPQSVIEHAGGGKVVQYRGQILPLVSLRGVLEPGLDSLDILANPVQVVVFNDGGVSVGLVVDRILDVAEEAVAVRQRSKRKGIVGSAVVGGKVTDFLDLHEVLRPTDGGRPSRIGGPTDRNQVLLVDPSAFSRSMTRGGLDMAGYTVHEAANLDQAMRILDQQPMDVIVAALDLKTDGTSALLAALHGKSNVAGIPVLALAEPDELTLAPSAHKAGFQDCQAKFDDVLVLAAIAQLISTRANTKEILERSGETR